MKNKTKLLLTSALTTLGHVALDGEDRRQHLRSPSPEYQNLSVS